MSNVPKLRFKEFSDEWEDKKLSKLTKVYDGTHSTPQYVEEGIPFYSVEHVTANQFVNTKYIAEDVFEKENKRVKLESNDILMTRIGDIGTSRLLDWDVKASFYVSLALIKHSDKFVSAFVNQQIKSNGFQRQLYSRTLHVAFPKKINLSEIGLCHLSLPSKQEQEKIASFLTSVDTKIEQLTKKEELLKQYKKGVMQQIFSGEIRFKADDGSEFEDWEEKKLDDVIKDIADGGTPSTTNDSYFGGKVNWIVIDDIKDKITSTTQTLTDEGFKKCSSKLWPVGTLILSTGATIGRVGITEIETATKQGICGIIVNDNTNNIFLKYWFVFNERLLLRFAQGSSIKEVRPVTIKKFSIDLPSVEEQTKIANFLSSIDSKIEQVSAQLDSTKEFKKALLQQMFV